MNFTFIILKAISMLRLFAILTFLLIAVPVQANEPSLSADQQALVEKIRSYLNDLKTLKGSFAQISSDGTYADGKVYMSRPGKMHLVYNPPVKTEIIVRRGTIIYHDKEYQQVNYYPLSSTPLAVLLDEKINFEKGVQIVDLAQGTGVIELTLVDREDPGMGSVTLIFSDAPLELRKWSIVDAQGVMTQVSLLNATYGGAIDAKQFDFVDPKYDVQNN
ncbi:LolA family protein [Terasakiella brassicae]|nr:outer membrane lipoprotein carrier protein LolA [Terasakiella brassicae]